MSTYFVTIDGLEYTISVDQSGTMKINKESVLVDVKQLDERTFSVLLNGVSVKLVTEKEEGNYRVLVNGLQEKVVVESDRDRLLREYRRESDKGRHRMEIHAPMPALVVKVEVEPGDDIVPGQGLIILEAMKMENEIKAVQQGRVKEVYATQGKPVEKGELLLLLE